MWVNPHGWKEPQQHLPVPCIVSVQSEGLVAAAAGHACPLARRTTAPVCLLFLTQKALSFLSEQRQGRLSLTLWAFSFVLYETLPSTMSCHAAAC